MRPEKYESVKPTTTSAWGKSMNGAPSAWGQQQHSQPQSQAKGKKEGRVSSEMTCLFYWTLC